MKISASLAWPAVARSNRVAIPSVRVTKGQLAGGGVDVLIGMDVITIGDFSITNFGAEAIFSFRIPSQGHVDYVQARPS